MEKRQKGVLEAEVIEDFERVRLADVADVIRGVTYKKDDARSKPENGVVPILRANNIQDGALELDGELVYVPSELIGKEQLLREGDIVIATSSGSKDLVGKAAPLRTRWMGSFGAFCAAVRPKEDIDPLYLAHFFEGPEYKALIRDKALGVNINNLRRGDLEELAIPLPPSPSSVVSWKRSSCSWAGWMRRWSGCRGPRPG
jgi:type I restriction enzyme S subunit